ncbi:MAG: hypothetical protein ABEI39_04430 [Halobacteriales archaeon]
MNRRRELAALLALAVLGVAFLRHGILTTVAAHFTLNAFVTALPMLASSTPWLALQGGLALLITLLPAVVAVGLLANGRTTGGIR